MRSQIFSNILLKSIVCFHCLVYHIFLSKDFWMIWKVCKIFHICWIYLNDKVMVLKKRLWHLHEEPNFFEEFVFIASFIILHGLIQKNKYLKSGNLQYNTLGRMTYQPSVWCSKYFFFHNFMQNTLQKSFQFIFLFFYNFT